MVDKQDFKEETNKLLQLYSEGEITADQFSIRLYDFTDKQISKHFDLTSFNIDDDFYNEVKEYLKSQKSVSTSHLQRRFRVGYARASRLIDKLEEDKLISPYDSSNKPRKVL